MEPKSRRKGIQTIIERTKDSPVEQEGKVKANWLPYREGVTGVGDWDVH